MSDVPNELQLAVALDGTGWHPASWREPAAELLDPRYDSWEDDAEIRDVASGRFVDRDRLHCIDFHDQRQIRSRRPANRYTTVS